jgi:hypothetical protein
MPGEWLSRQEVAELVNRWIFERHERVVELDGNYIGKLERGLIRWPQALYREALRAVLHVETDGQLGFNRRRRRLPDTLSVDVDRRQALMLTGAVASLPWLDLYAPIEPTPVPSKVSRAAITQVRVT